MGSFGKKQKNDSSPPLRAKAQTLFCFIEIWRWQLPAAEW